MGFYGAIYITNLIIALTNNSCYAITVLAYTTYILFSFSSIIVSFILMERTIALSDMTKYKRVFYTIHTILITIPFITFDVIAGIAQVQSNFNLSKFYTNLLYIKYDSMIAGITTFTLTTNNLIGNYYLIKFYMKQGRLSNKRYTFLQSIIYSRIRFIIFGIVVDILGVVIFVLLSVGVGWLPPSGVTDLGFVIQCIALIEFIMYDIIITKFNVTYYNSGLDTTHPSIHFLESSAPSRNAIFEEK